MEQVLVGIITKPQALKGEFRIKPNILNIKQFKKLKKIYIDNNEYVVEHVSLRETFVVMKITGVDSCESAEQLRNKSVYAEMEIDTNDNFDLVDFEVFIDGNIIGLITEINNYGSKDIITVKTNSSTLMLPMIDKIILDTNKDKKQIVLDKELFEHVVVYEN